MSPDKLIHFGIMSQLPTIISEPESVDADTQDGKDGEEKGANMYRNVFEYRVHQKLTRAFCIVIVVVECYCIRTK